MAAFEPHDDVLLDLSNLGFPAAFLNGLKALIKGWVEQFASMHYQQLNTQIQELRTELANLRAETRSQGPSRPPTPPVKVQKLADEELTRLVASTGLTEAETEITVALIKGRDQNDIAAGRGRSVNTIKKQKSKVYARFGIKGSKNTKSIRLRQIFQIRYDSEQQAT